jgi:hypothetical protein
MSSFVKTGSIVSLVPLLLDRSARGFTACELGSRSAHQDAGVEGSP